MTDTGYPSTYTGVEQILERLLGPEGCPWDKEQTREALAGMFLEECYEFIEAVEEGDTDKMVEELGDVLFHVMFQLKLGEESGDFTRENVLGTLVDFCAAIPMSSATSRCRAPTRLSPAGTPSSGMKRRQAADQSWKASPKTCLRWRMPRQCRRAPNAPASTGTVSKASSTR